MENSFIKLIQEGKIKNLEELKNAYRKIAKKTHPDIVGSDQYVDKFILFKKYFEEAKRFLSGNITELNDNKIKVIENYRYLFFMELQELYFMESSFLIEKKNELQKQITKTRENALNCFIKWKKGFKQFYLLANIDYEKIKNEKPKNNISNLRKPSLYFNLKSLYFNLFKFHITGLDFYRKQLKQNQKIIMNRLDEEKYTSLKKFLLFLIEDMDNGPAIFGKKFF